jgi:hypothetical protein
MTASLVFSLIGLSIIVLELYTGFAVAGWPGDGMVLDRTKTPGPFWFVLVLQIIIVVGVPLCAMFVR